MTIPTLISFHAIGLLTVALTTTAVGQTPEEKNIPKQVNEAIDRGVEFLLSEQDIDGSWRFSTSSYPSGQTALCLYTLLKCGLAKDHPAITRSLLYLGDHDDRRTYTLGCYLMALGAHNPEKHFDLMEELSAQLLEAQGKGFSYPGMHEDLSLTQYAALGLRAAAKAGVKIDHKSWRRVMDYTLRQQEDVYRGPAGFSYRPGHPYNGSMTTAGLACLAIAREQLKAAVQFKAPDKRKVDAALKKGVEWLAEHINFENNPNPSGQSGTHRRHYWLYGLERAGSLLETETFGKINWYDELVKSVLPQQHKTGAWAESQSNTCFTLLALRRATAASTGNRARRADTYKSAGKDSPVTLRGSGDVPLSLWIDGFGPKVIESHEWPEDKGRGPRVARVDYMNGDTILNTVKGDPLSPINGSKMAMQYRFQEPGRYKLHARVWLVHPGESVADEAPFESAEMEVVIDEVMAPWMEEYATDAGRNLLHHVPKEVKSSSQHGGWPQRYAVDGLVGTGWLCAKDDKERWIRIVLDKPLWVSELGLCPPTELLSKPRTIGIPTTVSISINKRKPVHYQMDPNPLRKTTIDLGKKHHIRQLEIRILEGAGHGVNASLLGFAEIELRLPED